MEDAGTRHVVANQMLSTLCIVIVSCFGRLLRVCLTVRLPSCRTQNKSGKKIRSRSGFERRLGDDGDQLSPSFFSWSVPQSPFCSLSFFSPSFSSASSLLLHFPILPPSYIPRSSFCSLFPVLLYCYPKLESPSLEVLWPS